MPLLYIHAPKYLFNGSTKNAMVDELTTIALQIERLPDNDFIRSTAWTYIQEYDADNCFKGGKPHSNNGITVEVNIFKGGLDFNQKGLLIDNSTRIIQSKISSQVPIYVLIRENEAENWGVFGNRITLEDLFDSSADA